MREFIKIQYKLYKSGVKSIGIDRIKQLAEIYLTTLEREDMFREEEEDI